MAKTKTDGTAGDGDGDSGGTRIVKVNLKLPQWLKNLRILGALSAGALSFLASLATNPVETLRIVVFRIISEYILNAVFELGMFVVGSIVAAFDIVIGAIVYAGNLVVGAFGAVGVDILSVLLDIQQSIAGVVTAAGPAAPIIAVALATAGLYAVATVGRIALAYLGIRL